MALSPKLESELSALRMEYEIEVSEDSSCVNLVFKSFPLGPGFNRPSADVLIRVPLSYPDSGPDMFWTDRGLLLSDGRLPQNANSEEVHANRQWQRFSWHHNRWNSVTDNIDSYLEFVRSRLRQKQ
jgi:hypothetical protein